MQKFDELSLKATEISTKIDFLLEKQKVYKAEEFLQYSSAEYSRQANIKKLKEKLNMVALSRSKANKANQNLLDDFDRVQKHLSLMDKRTEELLSKVNSQKRYLDKNYPNWREKANVITSPNYLNQEELFNMLDSLKCKVFNEDNPPKTFESFAQSTNIRLDSNESLVQLLNKTRLGNENNRNQLNETANQIPELPLAEEAHQAKLQGKPEETQFFHSEKVESEFVPQDNFINLQSGFSTAYPGNLSGPKVAMLEPEPPAETLTNITATPEPTAEKDDPLSDVIETPRTEHTITEQQIVKPVRPLRISTSVQQYQSDAEDDIENMLNPTYTELYPPKELSPPVTEVKPSTADHKNSVVITEHLTIDSSKSSKITSEEEEQVEFHPSSQPNRPRINIDRIIDSSESEAVMLNKEPLNLPQDTTENDSEDEFAFFD